MISIHFLENKDNKDSIIAFFDIKNNKNYNKFNYFIKTKQYEKAEKNSETPIF